MSQHLVCIDEGDRAAGEGGKGERRAARCCRGDARGVPISGARGGRYVWIFDWEDVSSAPLLASPANPRLKVTSHAGPCAGPCAVLLVCPNVLMRGLPSRPPPTVVAFFPEKSPP